MHESNKATENLSFFLLALFASWTLYCHILVFSNQNFATLVTYSWVPAIPLLFLLPRLRFDLKLLPPILIAVAATLLIQRVHGDDGFYLNLMVSALEDPQAVLFSHDTMHGVEGLPLLLPTYKIHTLELLAATVAKLTSLPPATVHYLILAPVYAALVVYATALLAHLLTPRYWLHLTYATIALMVVFTFFSAGLGNLSFGKMQQGKSLLALAVVPLIMVYTARVMRLSFPADSWFMLIVANIVAVGSTATGLYIAPLATALTAAGCWRYDKDTTLRGMLAALACFYPIAWGLFLREAVAEASPVLADSSLVIEPNDEVLALNTGYAGYLFWAATLGAWLFLKGWPQRMIAIMVGLFLLIFMNPLLIKFWATHLTGTPTFRRLWWAIPRHLFMGILMIVPFLKGLQTWIAVLFAGAFLALTAYVTLPNSHTPLLDFNTTIRFQFPPAPKLPAERIALIQNIIPQLPPRARILAPETLARWFIVLPQHPYPLCVSQQYLDQLESFFGAKEVQRRKTLCNYIDGVSRADTAPQWLAESHLDGIIVPDGNRWQAEIAKTLTVENYTSRQLSGFTLWIKP